MSFHCVTNAWNSIAFCDPLRGVFGATPAEPMHCLQQGLYEYIIKQLFEQKKIKKAKIKKSNKPTKMTRKISRSCPIQADADDEVSVDSLSTTSYSEDSTNWNNGVELSRQGVFGTNYCKSIDILAKRYGFYLQHQSDRNLPRTHFNSNYTSVSYKNANEMSGIFIVFLMLFSTTEGVNLDKVLGNKRSAQYIHLFELMLMLEYFCKAESHKRQSILMMQKTMPLILETLKNTLNRQEGNGMKIIKFHLPLHFAEDMLRFGSMANYDSGIGESHHKDFAKKPSQNTQRRKSVFEIQTAQRLIENMAIDRAYDFFSTTNNDSNTTTCNIEKNKSVKYFYCDKTGQLMNRVKSTKKVKLCNWKDSFLQEKITTLCHKAICEKSLNAPIHFFTQHNRDDLIFRADPYYCINDSSFPWHDWALIDWGDRQCDSVPAKLLIFMLIDEQNFTRPFKFGEAYISEPGAYALTYSFTSNQQERAHQTSMLVTYGKIMTSNEDAEDVIIFPVPVHSIVSPCIAVPYRTEDDVISAKEWIILKSRSEWYEQFLDFLKSNQN
jgi:hypothetical protein